MRTRDTVIEWGAMKGAFLRATEQGERLKGGTGKHAERLERIHRSPNIVDKWEGGSGAETIGNLKTGYKAPEFRTAAERVPSQKRRRSSWNARMGRPDATRLICGDPNFFRKSVKRDRKPGLKLVIEYAFAAGVDAATVRNYGAWCAGLLKSLESQGYDLTVDLWSPLDGLFADAPRQRENVYVRVKKAGERSDFTEWSAIFGPTGLRHLLFT